MIIRTYLRRFLIKDILNWCFAVFFAVLILPTYQKSNEPHFEKYFVDMYESQTVYGYSGSNYILVGDGETYYARSYNSVPLVSILYEGGRKEYLTIGQPEEMRPGESQSFLASFQSESGKEYIFNSDVEVFTLEPHWMTIKYDGKNIYLVLNVLTCVGAVFSVLVFLNRVEKNFSAVSKEVSPLKVQRSWL